MDFTSLLASFDLGSFGDATSYIPDPFGLASESTIFGDSSSMVDGASTAVGDNIEAPSVTAIEILEGMMHHENLTLINNLMKHTVISLQKFKCNKLAAEVFIERLNAIRTTFGTSSGGLIHLSKQYNIEFPDGLIYALENLLSEFLSLCHLFTSSSYKSSLMYSPEIRERFAHFNIELDDIMNKLSVCFRPTGVKVVLPPCQPYYITCSVMPMLRDIEDLEKTKKSKVKLQTRVILAEMLSNRGAVVTDALVEEVLNEIKITRKFATKLLAEAKQDVEIKPYMIIKQVALREFWVLKIHPKLSDSPENVANHIQSYLTMKGSAAATAIDLANSFRESIKSYTGEHGDVDAFALAKLGREMHINSEKSLATVLKYIQTMSGHVVMPEIDPSEEIIFEANQEQTIKGLFNQVGWSVIYGPRLSGKSCRILHCAHHHPKDDKDFVWINFDGITCEMNGISRISQTLYFRKCHIYVDLETHLNNYLYSLKFGSVVVFDNVRLLHKRLSGIGSGLLSLEDSDKFNQQSIVNFFKRLFAMCKIHSRRLSFIVVTDEPDLLEDRVFFVEKIKFGPLSNADSDRLIIAMEHSVMPDQDTDALKVASGRLAGLMHALALSCTLRSVRHIAYTIKTCKANHEAVWMYALSRATRETYLSMATDERLLASFVNTSWSYFDEVLLWHLTREIFHDDIIRWKVAFMGLLRLGWLTHDEYFGYAPSYCASLVQPIIASTPHEKLHAKYLLHYAGEMVRVSGLAQQCPSCVEYFCEFFPHFNNVLAAILGRMETIVERPSGSPGLKYGGVAELHLLGEAFTKSGKSRNPHEHHGHHPVKGNHHAATHGGGQGATGAHHRRGDKVKSKTSSNNNPTEEQGKKNKKKGFLSRMFGFGSSKKKNGKSDTAIVLVHPSNTGLQGNSKGLIAVSFVDRSSNGKSKDFMGTSDTSYLEYPELYKRPQIIADYYRHLERYVSPVEYVDSQHAHFKRKKVDMSLTLAETLAGHLSFLLSYVVSPDTGVYIMGRLLEILNAHHSAKMDEALLDLAEIEYHLDRGYAAASYLKPIAGRVNSLMMTDATPYYAARLYLSYGKALQGYGDYSGAKQAYSSCIKILEGQGSTMGSDVMYASATARFKAVTFQILSFATSDINEKHHES